MRKERKNFKVISILLFVLFLLLFVSCDPGGYPYETTISFQVNDWIVGRGLYLAFIYNGQYSIPKITDSDSRAYFYLEDVGNPQKLDLCDDFTLKFYSSEVTNATNWYTLNQEGLNMDALEGLVYYATNISNGLSRPELFDIGNDLPFYLGTNYYTLDIHVKELQTNR